jgi:hypothetical protein
MISYNFHPEIDDKNHPIMVSYNFHPEIDDNKHPIMDDNDII